MAASYMASGLCLVFVSWSVCCYAVDQGIHWSSLKSTTPDHGSFSGSKGLGLVINQSVELQFPMQMNGNRNESRVPLSAVSEPSSPAGGSQQNVETTTAGQAKTVARVTRTPRLVTGDGDQATPIVQKQAIDGVSILNATAPSQHSKAALDHSVQPAGSKPATAHKSMLASSQGSQPVPVPSRHVHPVPPAHTLGAKPATALNAQLAPAPTDSPQPFAFPNFPHHLSKPALSHDAEVSPAHSNPADSVYRSSYLGYPGFVASIDSGKAERPKSIYVRKPGKDSQTFSGSVFRQEVPMRPQVETRSSPAVPDITIPTSSRKIVPVYLSQLGMENKLGDKVETEVSQLQKDISKKASPGSKPASAHLPKPASDHRAPPVQPTHKHGAKPAASLVELADINGSQQFPFDVAPQHRSKSTLSHGAQVSPAHLNPSDSLHRSSYLGYPPLAASVGSGIKSTGKGKAERAKPIYVRKPGKHSSCTSHEFSGSHEGPMMPHIKPWSSQSVPDASSEFVPGDLSQMRAEYEHGDEEIETEVFPRPESSEEDSKPVKGSGSGVENLYALFLKGKLPPGVITHFSSDFEHGMDHWRDTHYLRMPYRDSSARRKKVARKSKSWWQRPTGIFRGLQGKMPK